MKSTGLIKTCPFLTLVSAHKKTHTLHNDAIILTSFKKKKIRGIYIETFNSECRMMQVLCGEHVLGR